MKSVFTEPTKNVCNRLPLPTIAKLRRLCLATHKGQGVVVTELIEAAEVTPDHTLRLRAVEGTAAVEQGTGDEQQG